MANHKSALKRIRQNEKRRLHNRIYRSRARTLVKKARLAIGGGNDLEAAREATRVAVRDLDMAASRGTIHKNNAARRKSRLMKQLAALEAQQQ
jgi:small subunit ribosomal protein S20